MTEEKRISRRELLKLWGPPALAGGALGAWVAFWLAWTLVKIFGREAR